MARKKTAAVTQIVPEGYTYNELRSLLSTTLRSKISVLLRGHPGVGKSSLARELAQEMNLPLIDIRLAQRDPAELCGVYFPCHDRQELKLFPPEWVGQAKERPCFVFLDEINAAVTRLHQAAAYQIVLEHRVGPFEFHPDTVVMGAGNLEEDNAIVSSLSSALCNRFAHFIMRPDVGSWLEWGARNDIEEAILAYIGHVGVSALYENNDEFAFPTPRSWEMASKVYRNAHPDDRKRVVAACIGPSAADHFFTFHKIFGQVDVEGIVNKGQKMDFSKGKNAEPSFIYAAVFAVAAYVCGLPTLVADQAANLVKFLGSAGLDPEYKILFLRQINSRSNALDLLKPIREFQKLAGSLVDIQAKIYQ